MDQRDKAIWILSECNRHLLGSLGTPHYQIFRLDMELLALHVRNGNAAMATEVREELLAIYARQYSSQHPYTISLFENLARSYTAQEQHMSARELVDRAIRLTSHNYRHNPQGLISRYCLMADTLCGQGEYRDALHFAQVANDLTETHIGRMDGKQQADISAHLKYRAWILVLRSLSGVYMHLEDFVMATLLRQHDLRISEQYFGRDHAHTIASAFQLIRALLEKPEYTKADHLSYEYLNRASRVLGEWHPSTITYKFVRATVLCRRKGFQESESLCWSIVDWSYYNNSLKGQACIAGVYRDLACIYGAQGKFEDALGLQSYAVRIFRKEGVRDDIRITLCHMASCYEALGKPTQAIEAIAKAQQASRASPGSKFFMRSVVVKAKIKLGGFQDCCETLAQLCDDIEKTYGTNNSLLSELRTLSRSLQTTTPADISAVDNS